MPENIKMYTFSYTFQKFSFPLGAPVTDGIEGPGEGFFLNFTCNSVHFGAQVIHTFAPC